jgi:two-component system response regulator RegA
MPGARDPRRLLLVEDDPSNQLTLCALLEDAGFEVETASSLAEAAARIEHASHLDAILLDRGLGAEDGLVLVPAVRAAMPRAKIIVLSGAEDTPPGVDATLRKGMGFDALASCLAGLLSDG